MNDVKYVLSERCKIPRGIYYTKFTNKLFIKHIMLVKSIECKKQWLNIIFVIFHIVMLLIYNLNSFETFCSYFHVSE